MKNQVEFMGPRESARTVIGRSNARTVSLWDAGTLVYSR